MWSQPEHAPEFTADVQRLFDDLDQCAEDCCQAVAGRLVPALDLIETSATIDIVVEVPGVPASAIRVVFIDGHLIVAGHKAGPAACAVHERRFHQVERDYGRFARLVRFADAVDASRARATLRDGILRVSVPRLAERRGREIVVPVVSSAD